MGDGILFSYKKIDKTFPGVKALTDVSFDIRCGHVHAITGGNGAGKSTLIRIATGDIQPDSGELCYDGRTVRFASPSDSAAAGIIVVRQEVVLCDSLSVTENLFLGNLIVKSGRVDWDEMRRITANIFSDAGIDINPDALVSELTIAQKQLINIMRAVLAKPRLLIMDEPSAVLTDKELEIMFGMIARLKSEGVTIVYISHRMDEIFKLSDDITVLRDGCHMGTFPATEVSRDELIRMMIGRDVDEHEVPLPQREGQPVVLKGVDLCTSAINHVDFEVRKGEILGIAGLVGSGRTELAKAVMGLMPLIQGHLEVKGRRVKYTHISQAIRDGIGLVPEDRKREGLIQMMSVEHNMTLTGIDGFVKHGAIDYDREAAVCAEYIEKLQIKTPDMHTEVLHLSGGNQQKVALARWLIQGSDILFLDEPTCGIDVGAKAEIYELIRQMSREGKTIIVISSDTQEIMGLCQRVLVMREGYVSGELAGDEITQENIMRLSMAEVPPDAFQKRKSKLPVKSLILLGVFVLAFAMLTVFSGSSRRHADLAAQIPDVVTLKDTGTLVGKNLGVILITKNDEWCSQVCDAFNAIGEYYGANMSVLDGDSNVETQTRCIEACINSGSDMILVDPVSVKGMDKILNKVVDDNIPLIIYDSEWGAAAERGVTSVSWVQYDTGRMIGEYLIDYMRTQGQTKARLVELTTVISEHMVTRYQGFHDVVDNAEGISISYVGMYDYQSDREKAEKIVSSVAVDYDYVIADIDAGAEGALSALRQAGNTHVKILSMGSYGEEPFTHLKNNDPNYLAVLNVDAWTFTSEVMNTVIDYYDGKELPLVINVPLAVVDSSNVDEYWKFE